MQFHTSMAGLFRCAGDTGRLAIHEGAIERAEADSSDAAPRAEETLRMEAIRLAIYRHERQASPADARVAAVYRELRKQIPTMQRQTAMREALAYAPKAPTEDSAKLIAEKIVFARSIAQRKPAKGSAEAEAEKIVLSRAGVRAN